VVRVSSLLALAAAFFFALAATLQQKGALTLGISSESGKSFLSLARSRWWLIGTGSLLVGYLLQAIALDNGKLSIIQPLLVTTVVFALPLGYYITDQQVGRRDAVGATVVVLGLALYASFGKPAAGNDNAPNDQWAIALLVIGALCAVLLVLGRRGEAARKATLFGVASGVLYGTSACLVKPTITMLGDGGVSEVLTNWEFYAMALAGILAFILQQISLSEGFLATSVATVSVANPIVSVIIGILLFNETLSDPAWHKVIAWIGLGLGLLGAIMLTKAREGAGAEASEDESTRPAPAGAAAPAG
jgi:drug/metabolite transporter (DMT)-like permease